MITRDDVEYVANLARLTLTEEEIEKMTKELGAIIEFANKPESGWKESLVKR